MPSWRVGMPTSTVDIQAEATDVRVTRDEITVDLADGRTIIVPLLWYPRLVHGTAKERKNCRISARGQGLHWPDLDEDISVRNLLLGQPSGESQTSFKRWLESRLARKSRKA